MARNDNKKYWWIKIETNFFYQEAIDYLMGLPNGSQYVVLYQMLCLSTVNTNGKLITEVGEKIVKYDLAKIQRDTKFFNEDTILVALEHYAALGLIFKNQDGILTITNHEEFMGFTTGAAKRMAEKRKELTGNNSGTNVPKSIELRVKSKEIIDIELKDKDTNASVAPKVASGKRFIKPTLEEVKKYCEERKNEVNAEAFIDFYESKGWVINKSPMKDWKASIRTWERNNYGKTNTSTKPKIIFTGVKPL